MSKKTLIIAEKPSVARDIAAALGGFSKKEQWLESDYAVVSSGIGHLVTLTVPEAKDVPPGFTSLPILPKFFKTEVIPRTKDQFVLLKKLMGRSDISTIVNACDAGREGELIFRLIYDHAGCKKPIERMWLQSMTTDAIVSAWKTKAPGVRYNNLSDAARCRSESDWIVGINGSRAASSLRRASMPVGRVQTPTLAILVHRESEIKNFVPEDFFEIHGTFLTQAGRYVGKWIDQSSKGDAPGRFATKESAQKIVSKCAGKNPSEIRESAKQSSSQAPKLFDLTTLQREANKKFKLSAKQTLDIAQALYEKHKVTTYPRTDSSSLPEDYIENTKGIIHKFENTQYKDHAERISKNAWVKPNKRIFDNSKISDHFAIIPTGTIPSSLNETESKIFDLIVKRFLAAFHPAAQYSITTRLTIVENETFRSTGKVLISEGWMAVYGHDTSDKTPPLCAITKDEKISTEKIETVALQTTPPSRFTEASLLSAMEGAGKFVENDELRETLKERGIGTPATRAAIIEGLLATVTGQGKPKEPYVVREGKQQFLVPTELGMSLVAFLEASGVEALTSPAMTGEWEQKLREMEHGRYARNQFMAEIGEITTTMIQKMKNSGTKTSFTSSESYLTDIPCPKCGKHMTDTGKTMNCDCGYVFWKTIAERRLSEEEIRILFTKKITPTLDGFINKSKKKFSTKLKLNEEGKIIFEFDNTFSTNKVVLPNVKCPVCGAPINIVSGKFNFYSCEKKCITVWKTIAGREMSDQEVSELIARGKTEKLDGFISKAKKKFSAVVELTPDGKTSFVFD